MRAVLQRVRRASVTVDGRVVGAIGHGLLALLGVGRDDTDRDADYMAGKIRDLRLFADADGRMNRSGGRGRRRRARGLAVHAVRRLPARPAALLQRGGGPGSSAGTV